MSDDGSATTPGGATLAPDAAEPAASGIGRAVRAARRERQLSMRDLAARIGTSQPFVSNIENGRIFPSLRTLAMLAEALEVPLETLLPPRRRVERVAATDGMRPRRGGEPAARGIVGDERSRLHAYRVELAAGEAEPRPFAHPGEDFLYVLSGSVDLLREGLAALTLGAGASLRIDGAIPHRFSGGPDGGVVLLLEAAGGQHADPGSRP